MKTKLVNSDLDDRYPVALMDEIGIIVARFESEAQAREWAARNHHQVEE